MAVLPDKMRKKRLVIMRTLLIGRRLITQKSGDLSETPEEAFCLIAVRLGQYEGKPMSISDVSIATGLPYASVDRHLRSLQNRGIITTQKIGRRSVQFLTVMPERPAVTQFYAEFEELLLKAGADLRRLL